MTDREIRVTDNICKRWKWFWPVEAPPETKAERWIANKQHWGKAAVNLKLGKFGVVGG